METMLTMREVARILRVRDQAVRSWVISGILPAIDVGAGTRRNIRISPNDIPTLLERLRVTPPPPPQRRPRNVTSAHDHFPNLLEKP